MGWCVVCEDMGCLGLGADRASGVLPQGVAVALHSFHQEGAQQAEILPHVIADVSACLEVLPKAHL